MKFLSRMAWSVLFVIIATAHLFASAAAVSITSYAPNGGGFVEILLFPIALYLTVPAQGLFGASAIGGMDIFAVTMVLNSALWALWLTWVMRWIIDIRRSRPRRIFS